MSMLTAQMVINESVLTVILVDGLDLLAPSTGQLGGQACRLVRVRVRLLHQKSKDRSMRQRLATSHP